MNEIIKKNGITYGIVLGLFSILVTIGIYIIDLHLATSFLLGSAKKIVFIIIFILVLTKTKNELKGILTFKDAFTVFFITAIIGIFSSTIFDLILYNLIDPSAKETLKEIVINDLVTNFKRYGAPNSVIKEALNKIKSEDASSIGNQILELFTTIAISSLIGLIFAAIFKTPNKQEI